jgi:hypothetical protein
MSNQALWLKSFSRDGFEIGAAPYPTPKSNEVIIRTRAIAINPIDWRIAGPFGKTGFSHLSKPAIVGCDVAGEIVSIGPDGNATRFALGDRILACCVETSKDFEEAKYGGYQKFVVARVNMTSRIPHAVSFEEACALPLVWRRHLPGCSRRIILDWRSRAYLHESRVGRLCLSGADPRGLASKRSNLPWRQAMKSSRAVRPRITST